MEFKKILGVPWWVWLGGGLGTGAVLMIAYLKRKEIMALTGRAVEAGKEALFGAVIPPEARPYAPVILKVARETGVSPFLIVALGMRESRWGKALRTDGTGDCVKRFGDAFAGPDGLPSDLQGCWGRGIMQIDFGSHSGWIRGHHWKDPYANVKKGAEILKQKISFLSSKATVAGLTDGKFVTVTTGHAVRRGVASGRYPDPRPLSGNALLKAAIAAYNTGEGNALISAAVGKDPDITSALSNYSSDVLVRVASIEQAFDSNAA